MMRERERETEYDISVPEHFIVALSVLFVLFISVAATIAATALSWIAQGVLTFRKSQFGHQIEVMIKQLLRLARLRR